MLRLVIVDVISFADVNKFLECVTNHCMVFSTTRWGGSDVGFILSYGRYSRIYYGDCCQVSCVCNLLCKRKILLSILTIILLVVGPCTMVARNFQALCTFYYELHLQNEHCSTKVLLAI